MIIYIHGFNSSPASYKARVLRETLAARGAADALLAPELPHAPADAAQALDKLVARHSGCALVGSSLGGYYAIWLAEKHGVSEAELSRRLDEARAALTRIYGYPSFRPGQEEVLRAVVERHIASGQPVGSKHIAGHDGLDWASSTIRYELHRLEDMGYLNHPHTSAGRVPTDVGYRYYVDRLLPSASLPAPRAAVDAATGAGRGGAGATAGVRVLRQSRGSHG